MRFSSLLAIPAALVLMAAPAFASNWDLDASHSTVGFAVRHMMVSNVHGKFTKVTGTLALDDKDVTKSIVNVDIETSSVDTSEPKRDEHLRSPDFFDAAKFPKMTFKSTKVEKVGEKLKVTGDLTIKGITKPVVLSVDSFTPEVKDAFGGFRKGATATTKINRKDFGLTWNKTLDAGGVALGEDITIELDLEFVKKKG